MGIWPVDEVGLAGETAPGEGSISSGNAAAILAIVESKYDGWSKGAMCCKDFSYL
jgi:hypothetical protein